jgi:hypothetical protein
MTHADVPNEPKTKSSTTIYVEVPLLELVELVESFVIIAHLRTVNDDKISWLDSAVTDYMLRVLHVPYKAEGC